MVYPPCSSGECLDPACCSRGHKFRWTELVGVHSAQAKQVIEKDNPLVTVVLLRPGQFGSPDFCCNRVYVIVNENDIVTRPPMVG